MAHQNDDRRPVVLGYLGNMSRTKNCIGDKLEHVAGNVKSTRIHTLLGLNSQHFNIDLIIVPVVSKWQFSKVGPIPRLQPIQVLAPDHLSPKSETVKPLLCES